MKKGLSAFTFLILLLACKIDREKAIDRSRFTFKVSADSHLFFKNVRQAYYEFTDLTEARWHVYRLSDRYVGNDNPMINPAIVIDWVKEESYLLIETNDRLADQSPLLVKEHDIATGRTYAYQLDERGKENMLEFATKIYEGIMAENELFIVINNEEVLLMSHPEDRENFRIVMGDFYRLIRVIR